MSDTEEVPQSKLIDPTTKAAIAVVMSLFLGSSGTTAINKVFYDDAELSDRVTLLETTQQEVQQIQAQQGRLTRIIYRTIIRANPNVAVPLEDLEDFDQGDK